MKSKTRILFIVQGEGRGHMTQAIALDEILQNTDYELIKVLVGSSSQRKIPAFFRDYFGDKLGTIQSPNLVKDKQSRGISMFRSLLLNLLKSSIYLRSISLIDKTVKECQPDLIINFHELLTGFWYFFHRPKTKIISIAHQYIYDHPSFRFPQIGYFNRLALIIVNKISTLGSKRILAPDFFPRDKYHIKKMLIAPPLIRNSFRKSEVTNVNFLLIYILNQGYAEDVKQLSKHNPEQRIHCFWDKSPESDEGNSGENLSFHQLDARKYLSYLSSCKALITTAGFESICEAFYLGKPVLAIPVKKHPEQFINAFEARKAEAAVWAEQVDLSLLEQFIQNYKKVPDFVKWVEEAPDFYLSVLHKMR